MNVEEFAADPGALVKIAEALERGRGLWTFNAYDVPSLLIANRRGRQEMWLTIDSTPTRSTFGVMSLNRFEPGIVGPAGIPEGEILFVSSVEKLKVCAYNTVPTRNMEALIAFIRSSVPKRHGSSVSGCECGGEVANTTHSHWCPAYRSVRDD